MPNRGAERWALLMGAGVVLCPKGHEVPEGVGFCPECGASVGIDRPAPAVAAKYKTFLGNRRNLIALILGVTLIVVAVLFLARPDPDPRKNVTREELSSHAVGNYDTGQTQENQEFFSKLQAGTSYFDDISADAVLQAGHGICGSLLGGASMATVVERGSQIPAFENALLVRSAISVFCPEFDGEAADYFD